MGTHTTPEISIESDELVLHLDHVETLESLRRSVRARIESIVTVTVVDDAYEFVHGLRLIGTGIPGATAVGRFVSHDGATFAVVHHGRPRGVVIEFRDGEFKRWVIGTDRPEDIVAYVTRESETKPPLN